MSDAEVSDFLGRVPLLSGLPDDVRLDLAARVREVEVPAGEWLFRKGDPGESAFVVRSGRLEFVEEGLTEVVFGEIGRGGVLGELAPLRAQPRSAAVRAHRDSELLELRRQDFDELLRTVPDFAVALTRWLAEQLGAIRPSTPRAAPILSVAVIGLDPAAPAAAVTERLATGLRRFGTLAVVGQDDAERPAGELSALLDRAERDHDRILLAGSSTEPGDPWTRFRLREADLVVAVGSGPPSVAWRGQAGSLRGCELLVAGTRLSDGDLEAISPRQAAVRPTSDALLPVVDALARRLAGRSLGLVLSGGGARAFAHLGVYEELHAAGFEFDRVAGASLGSLVAGAIALGWDPDEIYRVFERSFIDDNPTTDYALPVSALLRGVKTRAMLEQVVGDVRIEEAPKSFFCVSCDIINRRLVVHRTGLGRDAVYASLAIPGVFPPLRTADGGLLVDGGVLDNLPVETMARAHEGPVLASDVSGGDGRWAGRRRIAPEGLARWARRAVIGDEGPLPRLGETLMRSFLLGSIDTAAAAHAHAELTITPGVEGIGLMDWRRLPRLREVGRQAAREALESAEVDALRVSA